MVDFAFIDSGTGGIPYLLELKRKMPEARCVYIGDTANFPYGEKSHDQIIDCISKVVSTVIKKFSPKVIVIACNTISVNALESLRKKFSDTQFIGTVPAIKLASKVSKNRRIGLLATKATCENPYNLDLKDKFASDCQLVMRPDPDLISFIERKSFDASLEEKLAACKPMADFFKAENCDAVILGCTHFLNMKTEIQQACGEGIAVVDSCDGVVNHAIEVFLKEKDPRVKPEDDRGCCKTEDAIDCNKVAGVLGAAPLGEGVVAKAAAGINTENGNCLSSKFCSAKLDSSNQMGKAFPDLVFVSGFSDKDDENQYNILCSRFNLDFKGIL